MALKYHAEEAFAEIGMNIECIPWPSFALFSKSYYKELRNLDKTKVHDYCFIGSIKSSIENRQWVLDFVKTNFTESSVFLNTDDPENWESLGPFDYTGKVYGFCPKHEKNATKDTILQYRTLDENRFYFESMAKSKFCLCPAGDNKWSWRFYEVLMCESIPIVKSRHHIYRTISEGKVNYLYYLFNKPHVYDKKIIDHNLYIFEYFHLLPPLIIR
jgi:hypothetical protein